MAGSVQRRGTKVHGLIDGSARSDEHVDDRSMALLAGDVQRRGTAAVSLWLVDIGSAGEETRHIVGVAVANLVNKRRVARSAQGGIYIYMLLICYTGKRKGAKRPKKMRSLRLVSRL